MNWNNSREVVELNAILYFQVTFSLFVMALFVMQDMVVNLWIYSCIYATATVFLFHADYFVHILPSMRKSLCFSISSLPEDDKAFKRSTYRGNKIERSSLFFPFNDNIH